MTRSFRMLLGISATLSVAALALSGSAAQAQTAYALSGGGTSLFSFNVASTGSIATTTIGTFSGGIVISAIDFRASTGVLYGYSDNEDTVYTINTTTGALNAVAIATGDQLTSSGRLGIDFNPTTGGGTGAQFRIVTSNDENRVVNVTNGAFTPLGDGTNGTVGPIVTGSTTLVENAYTNNLAGATATTQYAINDENDSLGILANNLGTVTQVGNGLGTVINGANVGFDIFTSVGGANTAYLLSGNNFYTVDLATGVASGALGSLSGVTNVRSLAVTPSVVVVPEAGTLPMVLGAGLSMLGAVVIRRRNKK